MIISQDKQLVENLEEFNSKSFGFHKSAKAFQLIIKNIYSNPVKSVLNEILQNSSDSVKQVGKSIDTIELHLPSRLNPEFKVVDYGIGLPHRFMMEKYTLAFYSSKDQDEDMAGGFGCGRLSVLALTSTYNVISTHNGKRYYYSVFINGKGEPEIVTLQHEDTTDSNGFCVSCPVLPEHVQQFQEETRRILQYWKVRPIIKNVDNFIIPEIEKEIEGADWMIIKNTYPNISNIPKVVAGIYSYDITIANIPRLTESQTAILQSNLILFMGASDVSPQVNRQGLTYDNKTIINIKAALDRVIVDVGAAIQREFDKCPNIWDAKLLYSKYFAYGGTAKNIGKLLGEKYKVKWAGIEFNDSVFEFDKEDLKLYQITHYQQSYARGGNYKTECYDTENIIVSPLSRIFINDLENQNMGVLRRIRYFLSSHRVASNNEVINAYVLTFKNEEAEKAFYEKTLLKKEDFRSVKAIDVPKSENLGYSTGKSSKYINKVFQFSYSLDYKKSSSWEEVNVDIEQEEGIYIVLDAFVPVCCGGNKALNDKLQLLKKFKHWSDDTVLTGVKINSEQLAQFEACDNWKTLVDYIQECKNKFTLTDEEKQQMVNANFYKSYNCKFKDDNLIHLKYLIRNLEHKHLFSDYAEALEKLHDHSVKAKNVPELLNKIEFILHFNIKVDYPKPLIDINVIRDKLKKIYPYVFEENYWYSTMKVQYYQDYVRGVDLRLKEAEQNSSKISQIENQF